MVRIFQIEIDIENGTSIWTTSHATNGLDAGILEPKCIRTCNLNQDCPGYVNNEQTCINGFCVEKVCPLSIENGGIHLLQNGTNGTTFGVLARITCMLEV